MSALKTIRNLLTLSIQTLEFDQVAERPNLIKKLRHLTLSPYSGMNNELDWMLEEVKKRPIQCHIFLAFRSKELVGWAFLSKEDTDFSFAHSGRGFNAIDGRLFQVFVDEKHRNQGIASELYKRARQQTTEVICVCPWDERGTALFDKFLENTKRI